MPEKPSGQIKTSTIRQVQKNGDIYILERRTIYGSVKKYSRVISTKLISKIPKGTKNSDANTSKAYQRYVFGG